MPHAAGVGAQASDDQNAAYHTLVLDLIRLIEHVRDSLQLIEQTVGREIPAGGPESSADVIVLDDVSPRYAKLAAALQACDVNLGAALRWLRDSGDGERCACKPPPLR